MLSRACHINVNTVATFIWRVMLISARENSSSQPFSDSPGKVEELAESMPVILLFFFTKKEKQIYEKGMGTYPNIRMVGITG